MNSELLTVLIKGIVMAIFAIISAYVVPYLNAKIEGTKMEDFMSYVEKCVKWANQTIPKEEWERKKEEVTNLVTTFANAKLHLDLSEEQIDAIIEAAVYTVKEGLK